MSGSRRVVSIIAVALVSLALPAAASGATVAVAGNAIAYTAAAGETNTPQFAYALGTPSQYTVTGDAAPLVAGAGCVAIAGGVQCEDTGIVQINATFDNMDDQGGSMSPAVPVRIVLNAGDGNDTFTGGTLNDSLTGGLGVDTLNGGDGNDGMNGDAGNDILNGQGANDQMIGGADNDTMSGGDGQDRLDGGAGNDAQDGGQGFDFFGQNGDDPGADSYTGGPGVDNVFFLSAPGPLTITLNDVPDDGTQGQDSVGPGIENVSGGPFADTITGDAGVNVLEGQSGADLINGEGGNDQVVGHSFVANGDGNNVLNGGDGDDLLVDGGADETLNGGNGNDELNAGPGADEMFGGPGIDTVTWANFPSYPSALPVLNQVTITLDDVPDDGYQDEGDNAHSDNENATGFFFGDFLRGNASPNVLNSAGGDDVLDLSGAGPDTAICGSLFSSGNETVIADPDDVVGPTGSGFCDRITLTGPRSVFIAQFASKKVKGGNAKVKVDCLASAIDLCEGTIRLLKSGTTVGRETFELLPGESGVFGIALANSVRKALDDGKKVKVELRAVGNDNTKQSELDVDSAKLKGKKKRK